MSGKSTVFSNRCSLSTYVTDHRVGPFDLTIRKYVVADSGASDGYPPALNPIGIFGRSSVTGTATSSIGEVPS